MLKTKPGLIILILATALFTSSCNKKDTSVVPESQQAVSPKGEPGVNNGRLFFHSQEDLIGYLKKNVGKKIADKDGFTSLLTTLKNLPAKTPVSDEIKDLRTFGFPPELMAILNADGEVRIGDDIVWYHTGKKYYIPVDDEPKLATIKKQPASIVKSFDAIQVKLKTENPNGRTDLGLTATDSRHIKEFFLWGNVHTRFVHEVSAFMEGTSGGTWISYAVLRVKMEWKDCCNWNPATTVRDVTVNLTGSANLYNGIGTLPTNGFYIMGPGVAINESNVVNSDYVITLAAVEGYGSLLSGSHWTLKLDGSIYHYAQNDYHTNAWTNAGNPLW